VIDPAVGRQLEQEFRRGNQEAASWMAGAMGLLGVLAVGNGVRLRRRSGRGRAKAPPNPGR